MIFLIKAASIIVGNRLAKPTAYLALALAAAGAIWWAYSTIYARGVIDERARLERIHTAALERQRAKADAAAQAFEETRAILSEGATETRTIIRKVYRDAPPTDCTVPGPVFDSLRAARDAANAAASGKPVAAVRTNP